MRRAIRQIGEDLFPLFLEVKEADMLAQSDYKRQEKTESLWDIRRLYSKVLEDKDCLSLKDLAVSGSDLIAAGMKPGRQIGEVLDAMLTDVIEEPSHNDREYLLAAYVTHALPKA